MMLLPPESRQGLGAASMGGPLDAVPAGGTPEWQGLHIPIEIGDSDDDDDAFLSKDSLDGGGYAEDSLMDDEDDDLDSSRYSESSGLP